MKHLNLPAVLQLIALTITSGVSAANVRADQIAILHDGFSREVGAYVDRLVRGLQEDGFSVISLSAQQVCDKEVLAADKFFLYIIPNCRTYPAIGMDAIVNYARNHGHIMFLGGPFLNDPVWLGENDWMDRQLVLAAKKNAPTSNQPFGSPHQLNTTGWQRTTDDRSNAGSWEIVPEGPQGGNCFRYTTQRLQGWDGYLSPVVRGLYGQDHDLFVFEAKGAAQTTQVAVEIQEQDGSRWIAVAGLAPEWNRIALELRDFKYWSDSQTRGRRGGKGDELNPAEAHRVNFQLAHSHTTAVAPGEHSFWIANVGTAVNPVAGMDVATATQGQTLETIFPRYKVHKIGEQALVQPTNRHELAGLKLASGDDLFGGIPRTTGSGFQRGQKWRFIPLATASDSAKHNRAYPAWLLLNQSEPLAGSVFACLGWNDPRQLSTPPMLQAVSRIARRLQLGVFLQEAGSEHFVYWPGEPIKFGATIVNTSKDEHEVKVRLTVTDRCDATVLSDSHVITVPPSESSVWEVKPTLSTESSNDLVAIRDARFPILTRLPIPRQFGEG